MTGYKVVPEALRDNVKFLQEAADSWAAAHNALKGRDLGDSDIGLLGKLSSAVRNHNEALNAVVGCLNEGVTTLEEAARKLKRIADEYESRDAEYYAKFGYIET